MYISVSNCVYVYTYLYIILIYRELLTTIEVKDVDRTKVTSELENSYEHKLAEQMDRYDLLVRTLHLLITNKYLTYLRWGYLCVHLISFTFYVSI
jgi:hypothetical protein